MVTYLVDDEGCVPGEPEFLCVRLELEINKADAAEGAEEQRGQYDFEGMRGYRRPQSAWKVSLWLKETRLPTFWTFGADETDTEMRTAFTNSP